MPCCSAPGRMRCTASATTSSDVHDLVLERLVDLDAGQFEQVVDRASDTERLGEDALGQPSDDIGVVLVEQRLGEQAQRPDGCLQLVADVGDEVAADGFEPSPFGHVVDEDDGPDRGIVAVERPR